MATILKEILQQCKNLTDLSCTCPNLKIDWDGYNSIVALATGRVKVHIKYKYQEYTTYADTTTEDEERIRIKNNIMDQITQKENEWVRFLANYFTYREIHLSKGTYPFQTLKEYIH